MKYHDFSPVDDFDALVLCIGFLSAVAVEAIALALVLVVMGVFA